MSETKGATGVTKYECDNKRVSCSHCGHDLFEDGKVEIKTAGHTTLDFGVNESVAMLVCVKCGHIEWFRHAPKPVG